MFFPIRIDVPLRRTPWMNWALIALNILIYAISAKLGQRFVEDFELNPRNPKLLNYFTYAVLHANFAHLASNLLFLYIFGNNVNDRMGHFGYLGFYLGGGVIAGAAHVMFETSPVIGASGAVFAVTGAFLILFPRSRITILYFFVLIGLFELSSMWFILAYFMLNVLNQFSQMLGTQSGVAYGAHIGGAVFGATVCLALLRFHLLPRDAFDVVALIDRWNRRRQFRDIVASGYNPFEPIAAMRAGKPDPNAERIMNIRAEVSEAMAHSNLPRATELYMALRATDPMQVLSRQNQLDLANHLFAEEKYAPAADLYEGFLRVYPKADQAPHVQLMLGLIYSRYVPRPDKAVDHLTRAVQRLTNPRELELANAELARITTSGASNT